MRTYTTSIQIASTPDAAFAFLADGETLPKGDRLRVAARTRPRTARRHARAGTRGARSTRSPCTRRMICVDAQRAKLAREFTVLNAHLESACPPLSWWRWRWGAARRGGEGQLHAGMLLCLDREHRAAYISATSSGPRRSFAASLSCAIPPERRSR